MADLTERTAAAAVANNDSEDTSESDGDAAADDFTVLDEPIGDRRPAPANLPALCPELRARLAAEGIEQVFLVQVTVLPELLAAADAEGFSLPHLRYLVIDEADRVIEMAETGWLKAVERVAAATARRPASPAG
ncbi:hypothetical protein FJT64_012590 [Amphibalanus amphitrite]|uniref:ATP-dependent RNA helicase DDX51 n=1 Tax=Amphibalanus amphitrite TaxID=1232801 RepID=A0A6A4V7D7_AMPAM|nr:hypothetical protein FJT64_012590 [Amphibalanus amphitrite]